MLISNLKLDTVADPLVARYLIQNIYSVTSSLQI